MEARARRIHDHRVRRRKTRQHVFSARRDEARRRQPAPPPGHRFLIGIDADDRGAGIDQECRRIADASVEIPHRQAAHIAELLDRPPPRDGAHAGVHLLERRRRKSGGRAGDHARRTIDRLPPAHHGSTQVAA